MPAGAAVPAVAVICHPHPQHQGTQLNKVVHTISRSMNELGVPAIRFNFRGVGASEGAYADGLGETEDVIAVAGWARNRFPQAELWLAGFSFGAAVAIRAAEQLKPARLISVAPPTARMANLLAGVRPDCPWLIVQGTADEVVAAEDVQNWAQTSQPEAEAGPAARCRALLSRPPDAAAGNAGRVGERYAACRSGRLASAVFARLGSVAVELPLEAH